MKRLLLHAPGVHTGGGLVLLHQLLGAADAPLAFANLDARAVDRIPHPNGMVVRRVPPRFTERLRAEYALAREARRGDYVLCFHGMPPLFRLKAKVIVFLQNRNYLGVEPASLFDGRTRFRLPLERLICRVFKRNVDEYVVQTASMERLTRAWHGGEPRIRVLPFLDSSENFARSATSIHDFIYVADGEVHKNHRNLLSAWILLANAGLRPSLALTLDKKFAQLLSTIETAQSRHGLAIANLGPLTRDKLFEAYAASRALIFPSTSESFGLPLLEASGAGLPIVAAELDYVRDVCAPVQTFDPHSPTSIYRAVRRFLGEPERRLQPKSSSEFVRELLA